MRMRACLLYTSPGGLAMIPSGIAVSLPGSGYAAFVFARSGLGVKHGISLSNGVGVIDSDYRGEICVGLCLSLIHIFWVIFSNFMPLNPETDISSIAFFKAGLLL